ncbi:MAG TPA: hypothetical protein VME70_09965 [Mycobacteriales bacterium]|nr:hypothetical protein [Mycobacteriales bacterium]
MSTPAGHPRPSPGRLDDAGTVCALDGDGTALCGDRLDMEPIGDLVWADVPDDQRCHKCAVIMEAATT